MTLEETHPTELPTLDPGITLLEVDDRATGALHSLVLDHMLLESGTAVWVDAHGRGSTQPLAQIAPSMRLLERISIARGFTPWQHSSLLRALPFECIEETEIVVVPAFDHFYRSGDCSDREGERLLESGCSLLATLSDTTAVPIIVTRTVADEFTAPLGDLAEDIVQCELTSFGPRFAGKDFETLLYPLGNGSYQTTLTYWQRVLTARHPAIASTPTPEVTVSGSH